MTPAIAEIPAHTTKSRKPWLRLWCWTVFLTFALWLYPIANREIRLAFAAGVALSVFGIGFLWRHKRSVVEMAGGGMS